MIFLVKILNLTTIIMNCSVAYLKGLKKAQLVILCNDIGLPTSGNAPELRSLLFGYLKNNSGSHFPGYISLNGDDVLDLSVEAAPDFRVSLMTLNRKWQILVFR